MLTFSHSASPQLSSLVRYVRKKSAEAEVLVVWTRHTPRYFLFRFFSIACASCPVPSPRFPHPHRDADSNAAVCCAHAHWALQRCAFDVARHLTRTPRSLNTRRRVQQVAWIATTLCLLARSGIRDMCADSTQFVPCRRDRLRVNSVQIVASSSGAAQVKRNATRTQRRAFAFTFALIRLRSAPRSHVV